ncbi:hypothetical protein [Vreelandella titanicae]|uniref:hypothetical protein n=1 Tax=Vreelandella titanicae TaxID=664683 RepID=UPI002420184C|nr:hypothetical protein [Halomonas titanicae]
MSTIAHLPATTVLTQAHRDAMAYIQELAITISQQGTYAVHAYYSGIAHEFTVHVLLFSEIDKGNFKAPTVINVYLPGRCSWMGAHALQELQATARVLEGFLSPPTGDAA